MHISYISNVFLFSSLFVLIYAQTRWRWLKKVQKCVSDFGKYPERTVKSCKNQTVHVELHKVEMFCTDNESLWKNPHIKWRHYKTSWKDFSIVNRKAFIKAKNNFTSFSLNLKNTLLHKNLFHEIDTLFLPFNQISSIQSSSFANLNCLIRLFLHRNCLTEIKTDTFWNLTELTVLSLDFNMIRQIQDHSFKGLTSLLRLSL